MLAVYTSKLKFVHQRITAANVRLCRLPIFQDHEEAGQAEAAPVAHVFAARTHRALGASVCTVCGSTKEGAFASSFCTRWAAFNVGRQMFRCFG
jgi:hypothetical protein